VNSSCLQTVSVARSGGEIDPYCECRIKDVDISKRRYQITASPRRDLTNPLVKTRQKNDILVSGV